MLVSSKPNQWCDSRLNDIARLVLAAGAVSSAAQVLINLKRAEWLCAAYDAGKLIGTIALKHPHPPYQRRIAEELGIDMPASAYPLELGYMAVAPESRGNIPLARSLALAALEASNSAGLWLTTASRPGMDRVLTRYGFECRGVYRGERGNSLELFTRSAR